MVLKRPNWTPLITTPAHPEYPSAHSCISSAGATVLAQFFGASTPFFVDSDNMPGVTRSFTSFDDSFTLHVTERSLALLTDAEKVKVAPGFTPAAYVLSKMYGVQLPNPFRHNLLDLHR
jgi:hypothetical protein